MDLQTQNLPMNFDSTPEEKTFDDDQYQDYDDMLKSLGDYVEKTRNNLQLFCNELSKEEFYSAMKKQFLKKLNPQVPNKMLFITFNFSDKHINEAGGPAFIPKLLKEKILKKKCFQNKRYYFNVEQRSEEYPIYRGYHSHLLIEKPKKAPSHVERECFKALTPFCGNIKHVNVKFYNGCSTWRDKLQYLEGEKWDEKKKKKVDLDKYFRRKYNIRMLYSSFD